MTVGKEEHRMTTIMSPKTRSTFESEVESVSPRYNSMTYTESVDEQATDSTLQMSSANDKDIPIGYVQRGQVIHIFSYSIYVYIYKWEIFKMSLTSEKNINKLYIVV